MLGETAHVELGIHQFPVDGYLETPSTRGDEDELPHIGFLALENRFRQTDGFGSKVSLHAILDRDLHSFISC